MTLSADEQPLSSLAQIDRYAASIEGFARGGREPFPNRYVILGCAQRIREQVRQTTAPIRYKRLSVWKRFTLWFGRQDAAWCWIAMIAFSLWLALALAAWAQSGAAPVGW